MITSFGSKETEKIWNGDSIINLTQEIQQIGMRKLRMLNNSQEMIDLKAPPSNKLEKLSGKMSDFYGIRINDRWRIVFKWDDINSSDVKIMDYHEQVNGKTGKYSPGRNYSRRIS